VTVVLTDDTLVITLHGILSPAEKALAKNSAGAAQIEEFHHQLFANSSDALLEKIKRITGQEVREATAEIETSSGTVRRCSRLAPRCRSSGSQATCLVTPGAGTAMGVNDRKVTAVGGDQHHAR
jgi:Na+-translocating membrane potential-generating system (MpsC)